MQHALEVSRPWPDRVGLLMAVVILAVAAIMGGTQESSAHTVLVRTAPFDGAVLERAPRDAVLRFSEPVSLVFAKITGHAGSATTEAPRAEGNEIRLRMPADLPDGGYLVSWRVVSADSHAIAGSFVFSIGDTAAAAPRSEVAYAPQELSWRLGKIAIRLIQDVALMLAAGGMMFRLFVLAPLRGASGSIRGIAFAGATAALAAVTSIGVEGGVVSPGPGDILLNADTWRYGWATTVGTSSVALLAGLGLVAVGHVLRDRWIAVLGIVGSTESLALTGHSATSSWIVQIALMVHLTAAAYWLGSLWPLRTALRSAVAADALVIVRRFSSIAVPAVALLAAAALVVAVSRLETVGDVIGTTYGELLAVKIALVLLLLGIAAVNRQRLTPCLAAQPERATRRLRRNIGVEISLGAAILTVTALIAHTPPPASEHHARHNTSTARILPAEICGPEQDSVVAVANGDGGHVAKIVLASSRIGANAIALELWGPDGRQPATLDVAVELSRPVAGIEPVLGKLSPLGGGRYVLDRVALPVAGKWNVRVEARLNDLQRAAFDVSVAVR